MNMNIPKAVFISCDWCNRWRLLTHTLWSCMAATSNI